MKSEMQILNVMEKKSKEGKPYKIVWALIKIEGMEFVRKFYIWPKD